MNIQNAILTDEELNQVSGGQVSTAATHDMPAASTPVSSVVKKSHELKMSIIRKM